MNTWILVYYDWIWHTLVNQLANNTTINPVLVNYNLGYASWWVYRCARLEHWGKWRKKKRQFRCIQGTLLVGIILWLPLSSISSYLATILVVLVDEFVDKLILNIKMITPSLSLLPPTLTPPFPDLVVDSILPEIFIIEGSGTAIQLNLDEPLIKFGECKKDLNISYWF